MIYFKMEKIGNSTKTEKKRQGPKTLSFLLYRRPGADPPRPAGARVFVSRACQFRHAGKV